MRDNKRGTIEDPSTDRALALAFEQEKQERLLDETAHSVRVDVIEQVRRDLGDEAAHILSDHVALEAALGATTEAERQARER